MENQSEELLSRDEYIRLARQSCMNNLNERSRESSGKQNKISIVKRPYQEEYMDNSSDSSIEYGESTMGQMKFKRSLIRIICALTLFLSVFLIDKFHITYQVVNSSNIEKLVTSNDLYDTAENYVVMLFSKMAKSDEGME